MPNPELFLDRLAMDVAKDLERIDGVVTQIILDPRTRDEFKQDPNGVLVRLGMHPATTPEVNERVNRTFWAVVANKELNQFVANHYRNFHPEKAREYSDYFMQGLREGRLQNRLEFDLAGADHLFKQPDALRTVYKLMLHDLNNRGILKQRHSPEAIDNHIEKVVAAIVERKPIREHDTLEEWDKNYGVGGFHYGTEAVEVGPVVTAYTVVELGLFASVFGIVQLQFDKDLLLKAGLGDPEAITAFATLAKLVSFGADLLVQSYYFESR